MVVKLSPNKRILFYALKRAIGSVICIMVMAGLTILMNSAGLVII